MADSEDEYDRKRRDKFRGERSSGGDSYRSDRRDDRRGGGGGGAGGGSAGGGAGGGREDWAERNPFRSGGAGAGRPRPDYRDYRGPRDRYGSPGREMPPAKRMRPDWADDLRGNPRYGPYDPYLMHAWNEHYASHGMGVPYGPPHHAAQQQQQQQQQREHPSGNDLPTQPAMMTLKQFLDTQDDGISDSEVLRKYSEYKLDFKRQQLNEFFVAHKDEEWFKNKYHPMESVKRKEEQLNFLQKRVEVFTEVLENGLTENVSVDTSQTDPLLRLLDIVVIKLEGGTDFDLKALDEKPKELTINSTSNTTSAFEKKIDKHDDDVIITSVEQQQKKTTDKEEEPLVVSPRPIRRTTVQASDDEENWDDDDDTAASAGASAASTLPVVKTPPEPDIKRESKKKKKSLKRKRTSSGSSSSTTSESESSSSSSSDDEMENDKYDLGKVKKEIVIKQEKSENDEAESKSVEKQKEKIDDDLAMTNKDTMKENRRDSRNSIEKMKTLDDTDKLNDNNNSSNKHENDNKDTLSLTNEDNAPLTIDLDKEKDLPRPRALHRTSSIFLRNLAPSITKAEIEALCKKYDGYLRVAIADPLVERRWYRRGWVTFSRDVNIKEICWNLNNTRVRDCEMGAIVNRDLSRRVRPVNGMTAHKTIVRADIKLCAKIAMNLDDKYKLWERCQANYSQDTEKSNGNTNNSTTYGFISNNPVLQNITDYLIEEASAEEEELLGIAGENKAAEGEVIERDPQLISVLDNLILYLRVVHSVDFYNHCEYPYEDEMPNRCGIIHARGPPPTKVTQNDLNEYIKNFETKMQQFLLKPQPINEEEMKSLGCKDADAEVEKFIQANTQELAKDKWLCPLSGKKFKGPEFIRKHIFNKHLEKVDEVRKEVEFFNNYLKDPKRPQLPEHPGANKRTNSESSGGAGGPSGFRPPPVYPPAYAPPYAAYAPPMMMPGRGPRGFGGGGARRELPVEHQRRIIGYHDLDAPSNFDIFD